MSKPKTNSEVVFNLRVSVALSSDDYYEESKVIPRSYRWLLEELLLDSPADLLYVEEYTSVFESEDP